MITRSNITQFYKYLDFSGAANSLQNLTIKLSSPNSFNDPFDMNIAEALGKEINDFSRDLAEAHIDFISGDLDHSRLIPGDTSEKIILMNNAFRSASLEKKEELKKILK